MEAETETETDGKEGKGKKIVLFGRGSLSSPSLQSLRAFRVCKVALALPGLGWSGLAWDIIISYRKLPSQAPNRTGIAGDSWFPIPDTFDYSVHYSTAASITAYLLITSHECSWFAVFYSPTIGQLWKRSRYLGCWANTSDVLLQLGE
ncbi:uncharacterized protein RAG0_01283 [Rhynchosporium agropyri]|uniref:Uncharacterized protein n=1 Tax=Rhynchosporium agropyri TaxID=914238 RepID=A0A1E1JWE7_9HELO|nr:uncharacterized protein RAG0_01283 [Rhynchosporium agropyri]